MIETIEQAVRDRQPIYPPEQSAAGTNTYTLACKVVGYTPGYCVCLHKNMAFERDGGLKSHPECERAIGNKECPAIDLRQEERTAGKALYYVDRTLLREEMDKTFAATNATFKASAPVRKSEPSRNTAPAPVKKPVADSVQPSFVESDGYAAAINAAIKEAAVQPAVEPKPEPKVEHPSPSPVNKGLSMIDKARMQMGLNTTGDKS